MILRLAQPDDLVEIAAIYNHEVLHGTGTFDTEPVTVDERRRWLAAHDPARHPVVVADLGPEAALPFAQRGEDSAAGRIAGWASLSQWSTRCAYARAAEVSIYVHRDQRGRGLGRILLAELITRARAAGLGVLLARICVESQASLRLHADLGFQRIGIMRRVGEKFGRILDIELMDLQLDAQSAAGGGA